MHWWPAVSKQCMIRCYLGSESRGMLSSCAGNGGGSSTQWGRREGKGAQGELWGNGGITYL